MRKLQRRPQKHLGSDHSVRDVRRPSWEDADKLEAEIMTPRDRLQRLLFEHRTAHDPASSEREILAMFDDLESATHDLTIAYMSGRYDERTAHTNCWNEAWKSARAAALENAAEIADEHATCEGIAQRIAADIRALAKETNL